MNRQKSLARSALLDEAAVKYEIHYHDEGEYSYLGDECVCVTAINPNADRPLFIDPDDEFTVSFGRVAYALRSRSRYILGSVS